MGKKFLLSEKHLCYFCFFTSGKNSPRISIHLVRRIKITEEELIRLLSNREEKALKFYTTIIPPRYMGDPQDCATGWNCRRCFAGNVPENLEQFRTNMIQRKAFIQLDDQYCQKCLIDKVRSKEFVNRNKTRTLKRPYFRLEKTCNQASIRKLSESKNGSGTGTGISSGYRIVVLRGYFSSAAAEKLNIPLGTVKHVLGQHCKKLKNYFEEFSSINGY